jgi:hypothetical protein
MRNLYIGGAYALDKNTVCGITCADDVWAGSFIQPQHLAGLGKDRLDLAREVDIRRRLQQWNRQDAERNQNGEPE